MAAVEEFLWARVYCNPSSTEGRSAAADAGEGGSQPDGKATEGSVGKDAPAAKDGKVCCERHCYFVARGSGSLGLLNAAAAQTHRLYPEVWQSER